MRLALILILTSLLLPLQASAVTIGAIKAQCKDGDFVGCGGFVTACFSDCMYIEELDRSAGIRVRGFLGTAGIVYGFSAFQPGCGMRVATGADGEKELVFTEGTFVCSIVPDGPLFPLDMPNRSVGGGDFHYNPAISRGQQGIYGCCGLNNIGLLITTTGRVTARSGLTGSYFYIDDGSGRKDGSGNPGIRVSYADLPGTHYFLPRVGDYVSVTGISTVIKINNKMQSLIRLRWQSDINIIVYGDGW